MVASRDALANPAALDAFIALAQPITVTKSIDRRSKDGQEES